MRKKGKIAICALLCALLLLAIPSILVSAASRDKVKIKTFDKELQELTGTNESFLKKDEYNPNADLTWRAAVVLSNRADIEMNGDSYNEELYNQVVKYNRLSVRTKLDSRLTDIERDSAVQCFVKGIVIGESMGKYSQARRLYAEYYVPRADADKILERLQSKTKRIKLTPDGQVTRTTNLPKRYKDYPYILASFPNDYYDKKFIYLKATFSYKPIKLKHYAPPVDVFKPPYNTGYETLDFKDMYNQYGDMWMEKIKTNLETRLNFDYRTVDSNWIDTLQNTYYIYGDATADKKTREKIKKYVNVAKKNHVIIESKSIVVEPSSMYELMGRFYVRCYVKFKVTADNLYTIKEDRQDELIYSDMSNTYLIRLQKNKWYEGYYDIGISSTAFGDDGDGFSVTYDVLVDDKE